MWEPLGENQLTDMIAEAELFMNPVCRKFWDYIKIPPRKWKQHPWGDEGGGFWVVAMIGSICIYYNDIEEGFNISSYKYFGEIDEYFCNQSDLLETINHFHRQVLDDIQDYAQQAIAP